MTFRPKPLEKISFEDQNNVTELTVKELIDCDKLRCVEVYVKDLRYLSVMKIFNQISFKGKHITFNLIWCDSSLDFCIEQHIFDFPADNDIYEEEINNLDM